MGLTIEILRPDDLLTLAIEAQNLRLDTTDPKNPKLVVDDSSQPAYLIVNFAPQHIIEKAYFETGNVTTEPPYNQVPAGTPPLGTTDDPLDPAERSLRASQAQADLYFSFRRNSRASRFKRHRCWTGHS